MSDEFEPNELVTKEFMTTSRSSLEDICQVYDVQREFGEQDQQAPIVEETRGFGQIGVQSFFDHEMTDTSPIEDMSYLQSQMHFDKSIESIAADSDLEDGEFKKVADFTNCMPKELPGGRMQWSFRKERKVHKRLTYHRIRELPGDRLHCFHQNVMNRETKRGVLCSETPLCRI